VHIRQFLQSNIIAVIVRDKMMPEYSKVVEYSTTLRVQEYNMIHYIPVA